MQHTEKNTKQMRKEKDDKQNAASQKARRTFCKTGKRVICKTTDPGTSEGVYRAIQREL
jgi:hypothetical protein